MKKTVENLLEKCGMVWINKNESATDKGKGIDDEIKELRNLVLRERLSEEYAMEMVRSFLLQTLGIIKIKNGKKFATFFNLTEREGELVNLCQKMIRLATNNEEDELQILEMKVIEYLESVEEVIEYRLKENKYFFRKLYPDIHLKGLFGEISVEELDKRMYDELQKIVEKIRKQEKYKKLMKSLSIKAKEQIKC